MPVPSELEHLKRGRKIKRRFIAPTPKGRKLIEGYVLEGRGPRGGKTVGWLKGEGPRRERKRRKGRRRNLSRLSIDELLKIF